MNSSYLKTTGKQQKGQKQQKEEILSSESYVPKALPTILGTFDMTSIYLVAIFFIVNATTAASGGPAAFTYLILGAITFFIPSAIATAQLGYMFPHEGSLYNWTHHALGGYWSFFIGFCAWFPGVLVMIAGADIVVSFIQSLNPHWLTDSATLVWAISSMFFFINLAFFYRKDKAHFHKYQLFPMPVLVLSGAIGVVACVIAIADTLLNSWIPGLIANTYWWYIIGGVTVLCIIVAGIGSMIARSQVEWEDIQGK